MVKIKSQQVAVLIFVLLLAAGCEPVTPSDDDYRQGTAGAVMKFGVARPSDLLYSGNHMNVLVEVWNMGAAYITEGRVYLSGFDKDAISFSGYNPTGRYVYMDFPEIIGKGPYGQTGGFEDVEFQEDNPLSVPFGDSYKTKIMATVCYKYQTVATPEVCVLSEPEELRTEDVCKPSTIKLENQGAPVAVTEVEEHVMEQKLSFMITVKNVGGGKIINPKSFSRCPFDLGIYDKDVVSITLEMSGAGKITCTPSDNLIRLSNNEGVIRCEVPIELKTTWLTPLIITLDYGYSSSITKDVEILNVPSESSYTGKRRTT